MDEANNSMPAKRPSHKCLMTNGNFSDAVIACGDRTFKVHQAIVSERCEFFAKCFRHPCKESSEMKVTLPKDDPDAVHGMIYYLYTLCYPKDLKDSLKRSLAVCPAVLTPQYFEQLGHLHWMYDLELYKSAHKLGLEYLAKLAMEHIEKLVTTTDPDLFLARVSGFVSLVEHMYHVPLQASSDDGDSVHVDKHEKTDAARAQQEAKEEREMYVEHLHHAKQLLLNSTATLVARYIKNEQLDRLTQTNAQFRRDVFHTLERQHAAVVLKAHIAG